MKCSETIARREIVQSAETVHEIAASSGMGLYGVQRLAVLRVREKKWRRVWKRVGNRLVPAYLVCPKTGQTKP